MFLFAFALMKRFQWTCVSCCDIIEKRGNMKKRINSKFNSSSDCSISSIISRNIELVWFPFSFSLSSSQLRARKFRIWICMIKLKSISFVVSALITWECWSSHYMKRHLNEHVQMLDISCFAVPNDENVRKYSVRISSIHLQSEQRRITSKPMMQQKMRVNRNSSQMNDMHYCIHNTWLDERIFRFFS